MHIYGVELVSCVPISGYWVDMVAACVLAGFGVLFGLIIGINVMTPNPKRLGTDMVGPK
jgi:hypothetical protein